MPDVFFDNPPVLQGDEKTQLRQLSGYLYSISSKLNEAMMTVSIQEAQLERQIKQQTTATPSGQQEESTQIYDTLKSLIVKTAEIIRTEMEEISTNLHSETEAISEQFGKLEENIDLTMRATAEGVLQDYHYSETVTDTRTNTEFRTKTNQYIFTGLLNDNPVEYGIAIGEGVTAYDSDGNPYLNQNAKVATFTMNKLAFWQGNTELAYFSSGRFYIANGEITGTLTIGNYTWKAMADQSMVLLRI